MGARQKPAEWLWIDDTLHWPSLPLWDRLRPSPRVRDALLDVLRTVALVALLALAVWSVWQIVMAVAVLGPWVLSGQGW